MFRVKICGLKEYDNALAVIEAGADALGLNFYRASRRCVEIETAREIAQAARGRAHVVGLFVNAPLQEVVQTHARVGLDWIQLHGDEPLEFAQSVHQETGAQVVAACRGQLRRWPVTGDADFSPAAHLLDAAVSGAYGGTGQLADWTTARHWRKTAGVRHLVLAGGLTPENVAEAIATVRPTAVDVAGGVEGKAGPGVKDVAKVAAFVQAARAAFAASDTPSP